MRKDLSVEYANVHYGWVGAIKHRWLEIHEQNPRHSQLGLKRTLNMRKDHAAARHRSDEPYSKIVPICGV